MPNTALGRTNIAPLTNKSGGDLTQGAVVVISGGTAAAFTTTTAVAFTDGAVGVILEPNGIANNATGLVAFAGWIPKVNLSGSAGLGDLFHTHSVGGQAVRHAAPAVAGDVGMVLATGTSPAALLFGQPVPPSATGNIATDAIWSAAGDLAQGTGLHTAAKLSIGSAGRVLASDPSAALNYVGGLQFINDSLVGGGGAASITFSSIPGGFRHLWLFIMGRCDAAGVTTKDVLMQFNGDTGSNYDNEALYYSGSGANAAAAENLGVAYADIGFIAAATALANVPGMVEVVIPAYAGTTFFKTGRSRSALDRSGTTGTFYSIETAFVWKNTGAITSIKLYPATGNFIGGTIATLYGVSI